MTNIQAINLLKGLEQSLDDYCELNDEGKTAFRMAITALEVFGISEQLPSAQPEQEPKVTQCDQCKYYHNKQYKPTDPNWRWKDDETEPEYIKPCKAGSYDKIIK